MSAVVVTLNGVPIKGAVVVAYAPAAFPLPAFTSNATTNENGTASIADPTITNAGLGATVTVSAKYVDAQGKTYIAQAQVTAVSNWNLATGFLGWSPDPLSLSLVQTNDPTLLTQVNSDIQNSQSNQAGGVYGSLNTFVWIAIALVLVYLAVNLFGRYRR